MTWLENKACGDLSHTTHGSTSIQVGLIVVDGSSVRPELPDMEHQGTPLLPVECDVEKLKQWSGGLHPWRLELYAVWRLSAGQNRSISSTRAQLTRMDRRC